MNSAGKAKTTNPKKDKPERLQTHEKARCKVDCRPEEKSEVEVVEKNLSCESTTWTCERAVISNYCDPVQLCPTFGARDKFMFQK